MIEMNNCESCGNCKGIKVIEEGSRSFTEVIEEMANIYEMKNADYGNSFEEIFEEFGMMSVIIRLTDKLNRLKSIEASGKIKVSDESVVDTLIDMANYSIMAVVELEKQIERVDD